MGKRPIAATPQPITLQEILENVERLYVLGNSGVSETGVIQDRNRLVPASEIAYGASG
jgi:hypothetical protein